MKFPASGCKRVSHHIVKLVGKHLNITVVGQQPDKLCECDIVQHGLITVNFEPASFATLLKGRLSE
jgi:hypothetical protein